MYSLAVPIFSAHFFLFPTDPVYPVGYLVPIPFLGPVIYIIFSLANIYLVCKVMCSFYFMADHIILTYFVFWELLLHETRLGRGKYKLSNNLRRYPNLIYCHRALQIFLTLYTESIGMLFPLTHIIVLKLSLYSQVSLIRKWNKLDKLTVAILVFASISGQAVWLFALHYSGDMVTESKRTVSSWKGREWKTSGETKFMKKFSKSCRPMTINYHNVYILKRSSILRFLKNVCRGTLRALLTIRNRRRFM